MAGTAVLPASILEELEHFLEMIHLGVGPKNAAVACNWTFKQLPEFQEAMKYARERSIESIEAKAFELARAGNVPMIQMILFSHAADKGWRPPTQRVAVTHQGAIKVEQLQAAKAAMLEVMYEHGTDALAVGGPLDNDIMDAEIVES